MIIMIARDDENEKPKYQKCVLTEEKNIGELFDNITEASTSGNRCGRRVVLGIVIVNG